MVFDPALQKILREAQEGRLPQALQLARAFVGRQPGNANALQVLSFLLTSSGQHQQALHHLARAVQLAPGIAGFHNNYGSALLHAGRPREAAAEFRRARELDPKYALACAGLATACIQLFDSPGAIAAAEDGLRLRPDWPEVTVALANALAAADRLEEALALLEGHLRQHPQDQLVRSALLLTLHYGGRTTAQITQAHREFHALVPPPPPHPAADPRPERPLRIGVLSPDLHTHPVAFFAGAIFQHKPRSDRLIAFSTSPPTPHDPLTKRLRPLFDEWIEAAAMSDEALDQAVRERRVDVLVDLAGHTSGGRLPALSKKPAPVIVSAIGYPNSSAHPAVDWRLVDAVTDPPGSEESCTERLLRLDPCFLCYQPLASAPEPALPEEGSPFTFGSFNLLSKISEQTLVLWRRCLAAVPGSRLLLKSKALVDPAAQARFLERLAAAGIGREQVECVGYVERIEGHLALYRRMHVALDPTPYNGTTTTCEALWMGVPVVVLEGDRHGARVGASLLRAAGRPQWVTGTEDDYVALAARLGADRSALAAERATLRSDLRQSVLLDGAAYAARFHAALRQAWTEACESAAAKSGRGPSGR